MKDRGRIYNIVFSILLGLIACYLLAQVIINGQASLDFCLIAAGALLIRYLDIPFFGHVASPTGGVIVASFFLFSPVPALFIVTLSSLGFFLFRPVTHLIAEDMVSAVAAELGGAIISLYFLYYVLQPQVPPESFTTYSFSLLVAVASVLLVYYLAKNVVAILSQFPSREAVVRALRLTIRPLYFGLSLMTGITSLLLVPVYMQMGIPGFLLGLIPLGVFFFACRLYLQMRSVYAQSLRALVGVIEALDPYTHGHSDRVTYLAVEVGKRLGFSESHLYLLEYAAYLHDMGKVTIDPTILRKPSSLTEEEWKVIKSHPVDGADILQPVGFLHRILPWIIYHHERPNGQGYPEALSFDQIPLEARIIAAADAFDAMTSDRPYRRALTVQETVEEMTRNAGTQFDEKVVSLIRSLVLSPHFFAGLRSRLR